MEKKNNSLVIILMGVIIVILAVLCVLFATGTIALKSNESNNEVNNQEIEEQNENNVVDNTTDNENNSELLGYYRRMEQIDSTETLIFEIELKSDNSVLYSIGVSHTSNYFDASSVMKYSGTYSIDNKDIILNLKSTDNNCVDGKYKCNEELKLWKQQNDDNSKSGDLILYGEDAPTYSKTDKVYLLNK